MRIKLVLEIDPFNEHLAVEAVLNIAEYNFPIWYKLDNGNLVELPTKHAELKIKE